MNMMQAMQPTLAPRASNSSQDHAHVDHLLRDQPPYPTSHPSPPQDRLDTMSHSGGPSPPSPQNNADMMTGSADSDGGENAADGRRGYGKRELSTSKRAAQNRAAQRAFRQRKEGYIKKLEEQVRDYQLLSENFKSVQAENYQLRDYIINLQSRLLESQGEVPPPPSNVDGLQPGKAGPMQQQQASLPRISELGGMGGPQDHQRSIPEQHYQYPEPPIKRVRTSSGEMTPSQAALQGPSILAHPSTQPR